MPHSTAAGKGPRKHATAAADELALAQVAQHAGEGFWGDAQLGGYRALALGQFHGQTAGLIGGFGMSQ
jgi:hypothetical protein